jgi:hypothetical protein
VWVVEGGERGGEERGKSVACGGGDVALDGWSGSGGEAKEAGRVRCRMRAGRVGMQASR